MEKIIDYMFSTGYIHDVVKYSYRLNIFFKNINKFNLYSKSVLPKIQFFFSLLTLLLKLLFRLKWPIFYLGVGDFFK